MKFQKHSMYHSKKKKKKTKTKQKHADPKYMPPNISVVGITHTSCCVLEQDILSPYING